MSKNRETYNPRLILLPLLIFEIIFWGISLWLLNTAGYFNNFIGGENLVFKNASVALLLLFVPLFYVFLLLYFKRTNKIKNQLGIHKHQKLKKVSNSYTFLKLFLFRNTIIFAIIAAMQPSFGTKKSESSITNTELVFAIDVSKSMNTQDMKGKLSRLDAAKQAVYQYINQSKSNKIGMVVFAGNALPQLPLTADINAVKMYAEELNTDLITNQGTNIGKAIEQASKYFSKEEESNKIIFLITDGEDHEGDIETSIKLLKEEGIQLQILGLGSSNGGLVPESNYRGKYLKDSRGKTVVSRLNKALIKDLSAQTGGPFVISDDEFPNIFPLLAEINKKKPTKSVELEFEIKRNNYHIFLIISAILLCLYVIVLELEKIKLRLD